MLIKTRDLTFPANFIILNIEEDLDMSIILERPFLTTERTLMDFANSKIILRVKDKQQSFKLNSQNIKVNLLTINKRLLEGNLIFFHIIYFAF